MADLVTPNEKYEGLGQRIGNGQFASLYFKREDLHPYKSHKGRSIPHMIDSHLKEGYRHFVISSSGNAALASAMHIQKINSQNVGEDKIKLEILVGKNINRQKLEKIQDMEDGEIKISIEDRPLQSLFLKTKDPFVKSLRQSNDDLALVGYEKLAQELCEIKDLRAVFIGTSSGTTAQALAGYFKSNKKKIEVHIVQTTSCHPIADLFDKNSSLVSHNVGEKSLADAIVDHTALRKDAIYKLFKGKKTEQKETKGNNAWIASNDEIESAICITEKETGLKISNNSALSVVGLIQAVFAGYSWDGDVACIICGE